MLLFKYYCATALTYSHRLNKTRMRSNTSFFCPQRQKHFLCMDEVHNSSLLWFFCGFDIINMLFCLSFNRFQRFIGKKYLLSHLGYYYIHV